MKKAILLFFVMTFLSGIAIAQSAEPIPFKEFITITEKVLDSLDELEVVFSNPDSMKIEVDMAFKKLDLENLKYRRYVKDWSKRPGKQADIIAALANTELSYMIILQDVERGIFNKENRQKAEVNLQKARELFGKYKNRGK